MSYDTVFNMDSITRTLLEIRGLQIPRHAWQLDYQPIEILCHLDLTSQPARLGQAKGKIQHVVLVVIRLLHLVVEGLVRHNDMASGAGAGAATCALHLEVVGLGDVEQVVAFAHGKGVGLGVFVDKSNMESGRVLAQGRVWAGDWAWGTHSSPGLGASRWPWRAAEVLEKGRVCGDVKAGRESDVPASVRAVVGAVRVAQWLENEDEDEDEDEDDAGARLAQRRAVAKRRLAAMADSWRGR
jgi:hypothetical protein